MKASVKRYNLDDNVNEQDFRATGARWYLLADLNTARGRRFASVCIGCPPMGRLRSGRADGLQWQSNGLRDGPDFQCTPTKHMLGTCLHAEIKYIPLGWSRSGFAQGLHLQINGLRDGQDLQRMPTTHILRTCPIARSKYIQIRERRSATPSE